MNLDLGSGIYPKKGFLQVDAYTPADVQARVEALPFADGSCDVVRLCHVLEHVPIRSVPTVLGECRRVMRPDGELRVEVPDMDPIARQWLDQGAVMVFMVYGGQQTDGEYHKCGFNAQSLVHALRDADLQVIGLREVFSHECDSLEATCVA